MKSITVRNEAGIAKPDIRGLIEVWLDSADVRDITKRTYSIGAMSFVDWAEGFEGDPDSIGVAFKGFLGEQGYKANTIATYLTGASLFCESLKDRGLLRSNPFDGVRRPEGERRKGEISRDELRAILAQVDQGDIAGLRDYAVITLLYKTGLRVSEVSKANVGDIKTREGRPVLHVLGKKRDNKSEFVLLLGEAHRALIEYIEAREAQGDRIEDEGPIFVGVGNRSKGKRLSAKSINRLFKDYVKAAGRRVRQDLSPHYCRHFAITEAISNGASPTQVMGMSRHRSLETVLRYFHERNRVDNGGEHYVRDIEIEAMP